ncbi:Transcription factor grauzone [Pseudolycoriella hygida]|uniref:Transcription factor grauzone n=1 Tax=Pseudolycoriella hygida TaxID=35572 RepID=A0A9Q0NAF9_9DIPT|nr:Transcription factor grauzone [Pseudolycoriella hygida]
MLQTINSQIIEEDVYSGSEGSHLEDESSSKKSKSVEDTTPAAIEWKRYNRPGPAEDALIREYFTMKCDICSDTVEFENFSNARHHYRRVHKMKGYLKCCGTKYDCPDRVLNHINYHTNPDALRCKQCGKYVKSEKSLELHIASHAPLDSRAFKCDLCTSSFPSTLRLKCHVQNKHTSKTGEKFPCDKCGKNFRSELLLACHVRHIHKPPTEYVCEICARTFKSKQVLENHIGMEHSTTPPPKVQCNICGAWLKHNRSLKTHLHLHNDIKGLNCPICNKDVRNKHVLRRHIGTVHGERRYQCVLCEKAFTCATKLKDHVAVHTGEDLYSCQFCEKKFKSKANMYSHRKKAHLTEWIKDKQIKTEEDGKA